MSMILRQIRSLFRQRTLVIGTLFVLALGIGTNTAISSVVDQILLRALLYPQSENLISIYASSPLQGLNKGVLSVADFLDVRQQPHTFEDMAGCANFRCNLSPRKQSIPASRSFALLPQRISLPRSDSLSFRI